LLAAFTKGFESPSSRFARRNWHACLHATSGYDRLPKWQQTVMQSDEHSGQLGDAKLVINYVCVSDQGAHQQMITLGALAG
jgi:hypothetical protein